MKDKKIFFISIISIFVLFILTACESNNEQEILEKNFVSEMEYIENSSIVIIKNLINDEYKDANGQTDWLKIKSDFNIIRVSSNQIIVDLASIGMPNDKILELDKRENVVIESIANKSESNLIVSLSNLYSLVPEYLDEKVNNEILNKSKLMKSYLVSSLAEAFVDNFDNANLYINEVQKLYQDLSKMEVYIEDNSYKINKCYVAIQEMKMGIESQQKNVIIDKFCYCLTVF